MSRSIRLIALAVCTAGGIGVCAGFLLPRQTSRSAVDTPTRSGSESGEPARLAAGPNHLSAAIPAPSTRWASPSDATAGRERSDVRSVAPISTPRRLPSIQPIAYEDAGESYDRIDRLERSVGRLTGLLEDQAIASDALRRRVAQAPPLPPRTIDVAPTAPFDPAPVDATPFGPPPPVPTPGAPIELDTSREIPLRDLIHLLGKGAGYNVVVSPSVDGNVSASLRDVSGIDALTALLRAHGFVLKQDGPFLFVGKPTDFADMARLNDAMRHRVFRPHFVTAMELQQLLAPILSESGKITVTRSAEVGIPVSSDQTGGDAYAGEEILLVRDYESVLQEADVIVADVDRMPLQAAIEAVILSVELDDEHRCGVNLELLRGSDQATVVTGVPAATLGAIDFTDGGLNIGFLDANIGAFVAALEEVGDTQVVARPRLTCINKQRAEILIGDQIGYLSTTQTETATTQTVEFLDVGTQLRLRPFISPDGVIRLEVHPELSSGQVRLIGDTPLPEKSTTQVTTNILCRDGSTVVIGGLIREETVVQAGQVPVIGNVPYLGALFRRRTETTRRTELIVLITPRILRDPLDGGENCSKWEGFAERQTSLYETGQFEWLSRKRHSDQYARLAQSCYIAGNYAKSRRYANIAMQFDPRNDVALSVLGRLDAAGYPVDGELVLPEETLPPGGMLRFTPTDETIGRPAIDAERNAFPPIMAPSGSPGSTPPGSPPAAAGPPNVEFESGSFDYQAPGMTFESSSTLDGSSRKWPEASQ